MSDLELVTLGTSQLTEESVPTWQACTPVGNETDDTDGPSNYDILQCLGVTSMPYPADASGSAQGIKARNVDGKDGVIIGARDTRSAAIVGNLKPGDTVLHSTGPSQAAQVQCKEEKRQVVLATKDSTGKTAAAVLDGVNDKFSLAAFGHLVEISRENGISLAHESGNGLTIGPEGTRVVGPFLHNGIPQGMALVAALPSPQGPGPLVNPLTPVLGTGS
jgi:hypothetical protein